MAKLTTKQKIFVEEYLVDLNATQAAIRAGYSPNGINKRVTRMMANDGIHSEIQERMAEREKRTEITQDFVLKELFEIAKANGSDFAKVIEKPAYDELGNPVINPATGEQLTYKTVDMELTDKLTTEKKKAIAGIKMGKNGIEVSTCDKVKALELLGRHLGMFKDKVEISGLEQAKSKLDNIITQMCGDNDE